MADRYPQDVLAKRASQGIPRTEATTGLSVTHPASGFRGRVVGFEAGAVRLRDGDGRERIFPLARGAFTVAGRAVDLVPPRPKPSPSATRTASGSLAGPKAPPRVARASRIYVEGVHDAALLEKVWGDDLREVGVAVEFLEGIDDLPAVVAAFGPGPTRRLGVLVDHLVEGSKESRLAAQVRHPHVLVTGHPFVDVWQAIRPRVLGIESWPVVPRGTPWKEGICAAFGADDPGLLWRRLLGRVRTYADLEPSFVGAVERLVDFVTEVE